VWWKNEHLQNVIKSQNIILIEALKIAIEAKLKKKMMYAKGEDS